MCLVDYDSDPAQISRAQTRTARKPHICGDCGRTIDVGERYVSAAWLFDGRWSNSCLCAHCRAAAEWLSENCGGYVFCGILEDLEEHESEYPQIRFGLMRLTVGIRRKWQFRSGKMMPMPRLPANISTIIEAAE